MLSLGLFERVHEPEEVSVGHLVRVLRSVRGFNTANGFNHVLHPMVEVGPKADHRPGAGARQDAERIERRVP